MQTILHFLIGKNSRSYWRLVPLRRLTFLFLGVFCLVGMVGCLLDNFVLGQKPFVEVFGWTIFTGIMAVVYLISALRAPRLIVAAIAVHYFISPSVGKLLRYFNAGAAVPTSEEGLRVAAIGSLVLCGLASLFFLLFIYAEGRTSIRLQTELSLAHGIQETLVPTVRFKSTLYEIYGVSRPSEQVGGDLVDLVEEENGSALAYVADISGHGLQAGILMGMFKTAARTAIAERPGLKELLGRINKVLPQVKEPEMYATCAAVQIRGAAFSNGGCQCDVANAGHPAILYYSGARKEVTQFASSGPVLGLLPDAEFLSRSVEAQPGDILLIATDGVTEVLGASGEEFEMKRVESVLTEKHGEPLETIAAAIIESVRRWGKQTDDQTLLLVRFGEKFV